MAPVLVVMLGRELPLEEVAVADHILVVDNLHALMLIPVDYILHIALHQILV